jgi:hypothetical protein
MVRISDNADSNVHRFHRVILIPILMACALLISPAHLYAAQVTLGWDAGTDEDGIDDGENGASDDCI